MSPFSVDGCRRPDPALTYWLSIAASAITTRCTDEPRQLPTVVDRRRPSIRKVPGAWGPRSSVNPASRSGDVTPPLAPWSGVTQAGVRASPGSLQPPCWHPRSCSPRCQTADCADQRRRQEDEEREPAHHDDDPAPDRMVERRSEPSGGRSPGTSRGPRCCRHSCPAGLLEPLRQLLRASCQLPDHPLTDGPDGRAVPHRLRSHPGELGL